ncbi:MAG: hypothetical protein KGL10_00045, partial [Alphaproteobacteria bacterium]|nr:hypothetical protein [Alphaproteobacteria bacterium]
MTKQTQTIWRVQNEFGSGPYRGPGNVSEIMRAFEKAGRFKPDRHPVPWMDKTLKEKFNSAASLNPKTLCGFKNIDQYNRWFNTQELRNLLHYAGFFLSKYEVEGVVWHGQTQSLFFADKAKLVAVRACNDSGV